MGNFKEALADFDTVINDPNATEKVWIFDFYLRVFFKSIFEKYR